MLCPVGDWGAQRATVRGRAASRRKDLRRVSMAVRTGLENVAAGPSRARRCGRRGAHSSLPGRAGRLQEPALRLVPTRRVGGGAAGSVPATSAFKAAAPSRNGRGAGSPCGQEVVSSSATTAAAVERSRSAASGNDESLSSTCLSTNRMRQLGGFSSNVSPRISPAGIALLPLPGSPMRRPAEAWRPPAMPGMGSG